MELLVATRNPGKVKEFRVLLAPLGATLCFPSELGLEIEVPEEGSSYAENAHSKATAYRHIAGIFAVADDSGLEVDALGGAPGIHSARYAPGNDSDRVRVLLAELSTVPWEQRTARFRCVVAMVTPSGRAFYTEGVCEGLISFDPAGHGGFGYDPVFYLPNHACTMAQLPQSEKNRISHRAKAIKGALPTLRRLRSDNVDQGQRPYE